MKYGIKSLTFEVVRVMFVSWLRFRLIIRFTVEVRLGVGYIIVTCL